MPPGALFFGPVGRLFDYRCKLLVSFSLAGLPVHLCRVSELATSLNLMSDDLGLSCRQQARLGDAMDGASQTEIRTVPRIGVFLARASWLATADSPLCYRTSPHWARLSEL